MYLSSKLNCLINTERINKYDISYMLYKNDNQIFGSKQIFKATKHTNNFITRAIETDVALLLNKEDKIECNNKKAEDVLIKILKENGWDSIKYKIVRSMMIFGDAFVKLEEDDKKGIRIKEISPYYIQDMKKDNNKITYLKVVYKDTNKNRIEEIYTETEITLTKVMEDGKIATETFENKLGLVPFIHFYAKDNLEEDAFGRNYLEEIIDLIINNAELTSICLTIFKMYADPTYVLKADSKTIMEFIKLNGGKMQLDLTKGKSLIALPKTKEIDSDLDIIKGVGAPDKFIEFIQLLEQNIKDNLPELALERIQQNSNASGLALEIQTYNLKAKIQEVQNRYAKSVELMLDLLVKMGQYKRFITKQDVNVTVEIAGFFNFRDAEDKEERDKKFDKVLKLLELGLLTQQEASNIIKEEGLI